MARVAPRSLDGAAEVVQAQIPKGVEHYRKARQVVPGGFSRARFFWPIPAFIDRGEGAYVYDIDGRRYVDVNLGFGVMILGHRHPVVMQALRSQLDRGIMFGSPVAAEEALARKIVHSVPGAERVTLFNSGTEATWAAARIARAITGRGKIAKFEGGWHGWHDFGVVSFSNARGVPEHAEAVPDTVGLPPHALDDVVVLPYNDARCLDRIRREADDLACVFVEAVQCSAGAIPMDRQLLHDLRELTASRRILLVVDEVITGFRIGASGAAGYYGVTPDLVTLGKVIGGGVPAGAVAGRADVMDQVAPKEGRPLIVLGGTFAANPLTTVAGNAQLGVLLSDGNIYRHLDELGSRMRSGIQHVFEELEISAHVTGLGSLWGYHFLARPPRSRRETEGKNQIAANVLSGYLRNEGVLQSAPVHLAFLSAAHTVADVDFTVEAHRRALVQMKDEGFV
jgi:glutamate-1-semialdehyde 2,1-aminomutase